MILFVNPARILRRDDDCTLQLSIAHIFHSLLFAVVVYWEKGANVSTNGIEGLADAQRLRAAILIDDGDFSIANLASECVAQNNELRQWHDHRSHHERRRAEELAHFALNDGHHSIHSFSLASRLQRPLRHYEGIRFLQFVAQLAAGVMNENIVQSRVLYRKRLYGDAGSDSHLNQFRRSAGTVAG